MTLEIHLLAKVATFARRLMYDVPFWGVTLSPTGDSAEGPSYIGRRPYPKHLLI